MWLHFKWRKVSYLKCLLWRLVKFRITFTLKYTHLFSTAFLLINLNICQTSCCYLSIKTARPSDTNRLICLPNKNNERLANIFCCITYPLDVITENNKILIIRFDLSLPPALRSLPSFNMNNSWISFWTVPLLSSVFWKVRHYRSFQIELNWSKRFISNSFTFYIWRFYILLMLGW